MAISLIRLPLSESSNPEECGAEHQQRAYNRSLMDQALLDQRDCIFPPSHPDPQAQRRGER
jgi:hypothetical protein